MRKFGPNKTALHFKHGKETAEEEVSPEGTGCVLKHEDGLCCLRVQERPAYPPWSPKLRTCLWLAIRGP